MDYELVLDVLASQSRGGGTTAGTDRNIPMLTDKPRENEEIEVQLRDPRTKETFLVRAIFSSKPEQLETKDRVWLVRSGERLPEPLAVKIIERIEEEEEEVKVLPHRRPSIAERKGHLLEELLKRREEERRKG